VSLQRSQPYSILVVDDDHENLHLLVKILASFGYRVQPTPSGRLVIEVAQTLQPDLILLDICMPEIDGYEVCRRLKANERTADIPVIFISAREAVEDKVTAFQVGGVDYITKPLQAEEVRARVQTHLAMRATQQKVQMLNETLEIRVQQRTVELETMHQQLLHEVTERQRAHETVLKMTQQLLQQRSETIEQAYDAVHNGPLQELAIMLRTVDTGQWQQDWLYAHLQKLNSDLRGIYQAMREAARDQTEVLYLEDHCTVDLNLPILEILSQVFDCTLERDFPGFEAIPVHITPDFTPLHEASLSVHQKRSLGLFLQEALCNIGKHALGTTRIDIVCHRGGDRYTLQVIDNGRGIPSTGQVRADGRGTRQAEAIAGELNGTFCRRANHPRGVICEISWVSRAEPY
jgi:DNA-binding response OmpR family regulator